MNEPEQKDHAITEKPAGLSWPARIMLSLFSASGIGLALGFLISMDMTGVDGENGYAVIYNAPIMMLFVFLAIIFISNTRLHIVFAIISALIWGTGLINM